MTELYPQNRLIEYNDPGILYDPAPAQGSVIITTTSTLIRPAHDERASLLIQNPSTSAGSIWVSIDGFAAVADATRTEIPPGASLSLGAPGVVTNLPIYGITASGSITVHFTELG